MTELSLSSSLSLSFSKVSRRPCGNFTYSLNIARTAFLRTYARLWFMSTTKSEIQSLARSFVAMFARQLIAIPISYWLLLPEENSFLNKFVVSRITSVDSVKDCAILIKLCVAVEWDTSLCSPRNVSHVPDLLQDILPSCAQILSETWPQQWRMPPNSRCIQSFANMSASWSKNSYHVKRMCYVALILFSRVGDVTILTASVFKNGSVERSSTLILAIAWEMKADGSFLWLLMPLMRSCRPFWKIGSDILYR